MFKIISLWSIKHLPSEDKIVYLTFDDGPEPGITEFILDELKKYNALATFFCTGSNFAEYQSLSDRILKDGHSIGNHSFSHINGLTTSTGIYVEDVKKSGELIGSKLFRPPWGTMSLSQYLILRKLYDIILWSASSHDTNSDTNWERHADSLTQKLRGGDIVLFHFCKKHAHNTQQILPMLLQRLSERDFRFLSIPTIQPI